MEPSQPPPMPQPVPDPNALLSAVATGMGQALVNSGTGKKPPRVLSEGSIWLWGLAPILFAALRVLMVSRGDSEVLRALVQNLNVTALVLSTLLPLAPIAAFWIMLIGLVVRKMATRGQASKGVNPVFTIFLVLTFAVACFAMPLRHLVYSTVFFVVIAFFAICAAVLHRMSMESAAKYVQKGAAAWVFGIPLAALVSLLVQSTMWLPKEQIVVADKHMSPVYILSSDERWTSYMGENHKVHLTPTRDITSREAVGSSGSWLDKSFWENGLAAAREVARWVGNACH